MWKEVEHVILAPEKVIDEIVDVFGLLLNLRLPSVISKRPHFWYIFYFVILRPLEIRNRTRAKVEKPQHLIFHFL